MSIYIECNNKGRIINLDTSKNFQGLIASFESTIHLHGEATAIHSNKWNGINAWHSSKVIIHLPSHHNTTYNNGTHHLNFTEYINL